MLSATTSTPRLPRFQRVERPRSFQLTPRDFAILHAVARYRFLSSTLIIRLIEGSPQQILRRLQLLFHHGYLDRPAAQVAQLAHAFDFGNRPFVYGLGRVGALILAEAGMPLREHLDWTQKNARASAYFLAHTIEVAEVMIAFERACLSGTAQLIDHHDLIPYLPQETREGDAPLSAHVSIPHRPAPLNIGVVPDRLFFLALAQCARFNFALELDRGTMDIRSRQLQGKANFRRKLVGYYHLWKQGLQATRWGFKRFRVLTVTPSEKRIETMLSVQREIVGEQGSNLFLFTTPKQLQEQSPLSRVWISGKGEVVSLLP